jgi:hypothetical protein
MTEKAKIQRDILRKVWNRFNANVRALSFFSKVGTKSIDQLDRELIHRKAKEIADLFDDPIEEVEKEILSFIPSLDSIEVEPDYLANQDIQTIIRALNDDSFKHSLLRWYKKNPRKGGKLIQVIHSLFEDLPAGGILLRRSGLIILVTFLEQLFHDLFIAYITLFPDKAGLLPGKQTDQNNIGSIDLTEIEEQADKWMRVKGGITARITKLESFGLDCSVIRRYLPKVLEVNQRRNLFVHNDGIIDEQYLRHISLDEASEKGFSTGRQLIVSDAYLYNSIDIVSIFGIFLHQICWRNWIPSENLKADEVFNDFIFNALKNEKYSLSVELAINSDFLSLSRKYRRYVNVNHGIALRETGEVKQLEKIIAELKQSRPDTVTKMAIEILCENYSKAFYMLLNIKSKDKKSFTSITEDWPLFKPVKNEKRFQYLFS